MPPRPLRSPTRSMELRGQFTTAGNEKESRLRLAPFRFRFLHENVRSFTPHLFISHTGILPHPFPAGSVHLRSSRGSSPRSVRSPSPVRLRQMARLTTVRSSFTSLGRSFSSACAWLTSARLDILAGSPSHRYAHSLNPTIPRPATLIEVLILSHQVEKKKNNASLSQPSISSLNSP